MYIRANAVGSAADAIHPEVGKLFLVADPVVCSEIKNLNATADDVKFLVIRRQCDAVTGSAKRFFVDHEIDSAAGIDTIDIGTEFTPQDAGGLRESTVSIRWTVNGPATYATQCTVVTLD